MKLNRKLLRYLLLCLTSILFNVARAEVQSVGNVVFTIGKVVAVSGDGSERNLMKRSEIYSGDTIVTSSKSQVQIRMVDNAFLAIKPDSNFKIENYQFTNQKDQNASHLELLKGGFRAITGQIGKANQTAYRVKTPVATMGVRGTDYVVTYCASDCAERAENIKASANAIANGLYVGVFEGAVRIANSVGSLNLGANQFGFINALNGFAQTLPSPPSFLLFDRTSMPTKEVRDLRRIIGTQIVATARQKEESRGGDRGNPDRPNDPRGVAGLAGAANNVASRVEGASQIAAGAAAKVGSFASALDLNKFDVNLSDVVDTGQLESLASSVFMTNVDKNVSSVASSGLFSGVDSNKLPEENFAPSPNLDPGTNAPWTPDYGTYVPPSTQVLGIAVTRPSNNSVLLGIDKMSEGVVTFDQGSNLPTSFPLPQSTTTSIAVTASNLNDFGYDADTNLMWGRWNGGDISVNDGASIENVSSNSLHWILGSLTNADVTLPRTGSATYELFGATSPTDNLGNSGILGQAVVTTNFTAQNATANLSLNINNQSWTGSASNISLTSPHFDSGLAVSVTTGASTISGTGNISGNLVGPSSITGAPTGAAITYQMNAQPNSVNTTVTGAAALKIKP